MKQNIKKFLFHMPSRMRDYLEWKSENERVSLAEVIKNAIMESEEFQQFSEIDVRIEAFEKIQSAYLELLDSGNTQKFLDSIESIFDTFDLRECPLCNKFSGHSHEIDEPSYDNQWGEPMYPTK